MAKSPNQFRQNAAEKVQNCSNLQSNTSTVNELATRKEQFQDLEKKHVLLEEKYKTLKNDYENLKIKYSNDDIEDTTETIDIPINTEDKVKLKIFNNTDYNLFTPFIEKIKSEYLVLDNTGAEMEKCKATSISHKNLNTKCFEIDTNALKNIYSTSKNCEKTHSLHTFLDSIGMDKNDSNHTEFLSFMNDDTKLKEDLASKFNNFIEQYSGVCAKGRKIIQHTDGQECLRMENGKISTYGENSFSDKCAPLINLYMLLQTAKDEEIYHHRDYTLENHNDSEFQKITGLDLTGFSDPDATGAL